MIDRWTNRIESEIIYDVNGVETMHMSPGNIFAMHYTFYPTHTDDPYKHWHLIVANMKDKIILYRDGLTDKSRAKDLLLVRDYIFSEFEHRFEREMTALEKAAWTFRRVSFDKSKNQKNPYDCGMYVCMYAFFILQNREDDTFTQQDIDGMRYKFCYSILKQGNVMFDV